VGSKLKIAFEKSILKWHEIVYNDGVDLGNSNCELCILLIGNCELCPICKEAGIDYCVGTPYHMWKKYCEGEYWPSPQEWKAEPGNRIFDSTSQYLAYKELVFLENLYCKLLFEEED